MRPVGRELKLYHRPPWVSNATHPGVSILHNVRFRRWMASKIHLLLIFATTRQRLWIFAIGTLPHAFRRGGHFDFSKRRPYSKSPSFEKKSPLAIQAGSKPMTDARCGKRKTSGNAALAKRTNRVDTQNGYRARIGAATCFLRERTPGIQTDLPVTSMPKARFT